MIGLRHYLCAAILIVAPKAAHAAEGFYAGMGAGVDLMPDRSLEIDATVGKQTFSLPETSKWKTGWAVLFDAGYAWDFGLRTELEYSFREQKIASFDSNPWSGTQWDNSLMANAIYDIPTGMALTPYIGFGIGGAHISWGDNFRPTGTSIIYDGSGVKFAWQGIAGLDYAVTPRLTLDLGFRIKGSNGYEFPSTSGVIARKFDYQTRTVTLGFRYGFGS
jgi:opacity protein-like surface antigen